MTTFLIIIEVLLFVVLIILGATDLSRPDISIFEQKKRLKNNKVDKDILIAKNYKMYNSLKDMLFIVIAIIITILTMIVLPGAKGFVSALAIIYSAYLISKIKFIRSVSRSLITVPQEKVLSFMNKNYKFMNYFILAEKENDFLPISSEEELEYVINEKSEFLSEEKRNLILKSLAFYDKTVKQIMTKRSDIITIKGSELLGPLTLDKLYKSNQDYVLVIGKNIDDVKGILSLKESLTIEAGDVSTQTAIKAAKKPPHFINQNSSLGEALDLMIKENYSVLVVADKNENTVGLLEINVLLQEII